MRNSTATRWHRLSEYLVPSKECKSHMFLPRFLRISWKMSWMREYFTAELMISFDRLNEPQPYEANRFVSQSKTFPVDFPPISAKIDMRNSSTETDIHTQHSHSFAFHIHEFSNSAATLWLCWRDITRVPQANTRTTTTTNGVVCHQRQH